MVFVSLILLSLSIILASLGTWLSPLLAIFVKNARPQLHESPQNMAVDSIVLDVLIPAHNEPESLPKTLQFINTLRLHPPEGVLKLKISVGLSHWCTPAAHQAAQGADSIYEITHPGKWLALKHLIEKSESDWIVLMDSGVIWSDNLLEDFLKTTADSNVIGFSPSYREDRSSFVSKLIWKQESFFKKIENKAGGPISLHGATIFFRTKELKSVFNELNKLSKEWLNDDLVIALAMRWLHPHKKIIYSMESYSLDLFPASHTNETKRRKRMLIGNLQWISTLFGVIIKQNLQLGVLALRRLLRPSWAWWVLIAIIAFALIYPPMLWFCGFILLLFYAKSSTRRLLEAAWISLLFPYYLLTFSKKQNEYKWK